MYLKLDRKTALNLMRKIVTVAMPNAALPQLAGVFIEADAATQEVVLTSTNLENTLKVFMPAKVKTDGQMLINAGLLCNMLEYAANNAVVLKQCGNILVFQSGKTKYDISGINHENYPKPQIEPPENPIKLKCFPAIIKQTAFAANREIKPEDIYTNVKFVADEKTIAITATDKMHLAHKKAELEESGKLSALIPLKAVTCFAAMVDDDTPVSMGFVGNRIVFKTDNLLFSAKACNNTAAFLNETQIISKRDDEYFTVISAPELSQALSGLAPISGAQGTVSFLFAKEELYITCSGEFGTARIGISVQIAQETPRGKKEYWYKLKQVVGGAKAGMGNIKLFISDDGMLFMKNSTQVYVQTPCRKYVNVKKETANEKKKKAKVA